MTQWWCQQWCQCFWGTSDPVLLTHSASKMPVLAQGLALLSPLHFLLQFRLRMGQCPRGSPPGRLHPCQEGTAKPPGRSSSAWS